MDISHIGVYNLEGSIPWKGEVLARYTNTLGREKMIQRERISHIIFVIFILINMFEGFPL